ncbi:hypothetical protein KKA47_01550 [bacterium]|nr:hypothetical protein [bacterium]
MKKPLAKVATTKADLKKDAIDQFEQTFGLIRMGGNKTRRLLSLSQDLARLHRTPLEVLWKEQSLLSITQNEKLSPLDRYKKATEWLMSRYTPPKYEKSAVHDTDQSFKPIKIYLTHDASKNPNTKLILDKLTDVPVEVIHSPRDIKKEMNYSDAKRIWFLNNYKGNVFKSCQGITEKNLCCNYFTIDLIAGCPLDCTYCILQQYLSNNPILTIYTNIEVILEQIKIATSKEPKKIFRIGSGELSDSLALDDITEHSSLLVPYFAKLPNAFLELKTKTTKIDGLKDLDHNGHTIVAWSVNPQDIISKEEFKAATLIGRIAAAKKCIEWGYKVAFHFDPMIFYKSWKDGYKEVVQLIFKHIDPQYVAWISLGTLRFPTQLKETAQERFAGTQIFSYPFERIAGKLRYPEKIRAILYKNVVEEIFSIDLSVPIYLCMEEPQMWVEAGLEAIQSNEDVEKIATSRLR